MIATRPSVCMVVCISLARSLVVRPAVPSTRGTASTVIASATDVLDHVAHRRSSAASTNQASAAIIARIASRSADQSDHDEQARRDQRRAETDEQRLPAPDEVDQVADRHLQRPRNAGPEAERGEELGRETE